MRPLILLIVLAACTRTQYVPVPAAPKPTPNRARPIAEMLQSSDTKCALWTGRETPYGGVDSMLCVAPNQVLHIKAPDDAAPEIKVTLQTEAPPDKPPAGPPAPKGMTLDEAAKKHGTSTNLAAPKPEPKKK